MLVTLVGMVIAVALEQYAKAVCPILATLFGIVIVSLSQGTHWIKPRGLLSSSASNDNPNPKQDGRDRFPIVVTLVGMVMVFSFEQNWKAASPMLVTLSGMTILRKLEQDSNVLLAIFATPLGMMMLVKLEQSINAE